jgi:hypothetical protein
MMLTQLADVARRTGYPVVEVDRWRTRTTKDEHGDPRQMSDIRTVIVHHTANGGAGGNYPSLRVVRDGRPGLQGPLAQLGLGVDGTIYVIAAGHCNHAGISRSPDFENSHAIGIEAEAVGVPGMPGDWPPAQMDSYARLCAALVAEFGLSVLDIRGHKETCQPPSRKSDPSFGMDRFRERVAEVDLKTPPEEDDDVKLTDEVDLTPKAEELLGEKTLTVRELLQWPPGVRAARDDVERARVEQAEQSKAVLAQLAAQGRVLAEISATLKDIAGRLPVDPPPPA